MNSVQKDRIFGVMLGLAAGDRIGGPTRMALQLADSLLAYNAFHPADIFQRYLGWWRTDGFDAGTTTQQVFTLVNAGLPRMVAIRTVHMRSRGLTAGCNPLHRQMPLALLAALEDADLLAIALEEAHLTHYDKLAGQVSGAGVMLARQLVHGVAWADAKRVVMAMLPADVREQVSGSQPRGLSRAGYAPDVLRTALYYVDHSESFADALQQTIQFAGTGNFAPVVVGALAGGRYGAASIPADVLSHSTVLLQVHAAAERLTQGW